MKDIPIIIVGGGGHDDGLLALKIAELKAMNPEAEILTIDEAKEKGLTETYKFEAMKQIEISQITLIDNYFTGGKSARNLRREAERKAKKGKK